MNGDGDDDDDDDDDNDHQPTTKTTKKQKQQQQIRRYIFLNKEVFNHHQHLLCFYQIRDTSNTKWSSSGHYFM